VGPLPPPRSTYKCASDDDCDGIHNDADRCPSAPGPESVDPSRRGCPGDADKDGLLDYLDACPGEKGLADPDPNKNGCPKFARVTGTEITISRQVLFKSSATGERIEAESESVLAEVRDVIQQHPEILLLEVEGHTDDLGNDGYNLDLSKKRAEAVRDWLVKHGIAADRLVAKGYGEAQPLADNRSEDGRRKNRRVEFSIAKKK
jgi:OOP family OmpA-OmpF porin